MWQYPKIIQDNLPLLPEIRCDISKIPDDIGSYMAALEENLCANLETKIRGIHKFSLQSLLGRFDTIEHRMAVIRKYVKYGSGQTTPLNQEQNVSTAIEKLDTAEQIEKLFTIQNKYFDMLKVFPPFQNINTKNSITKYQTVAKLIFELLNCLRRVENIQTGMETERKKEHETKIEVKDGLSKLFPSLENIFLALKKFKEQRKFDITILNALCHDLYQNIRTIKHMNLALSGIVPLPSLDNIHVVVKYGNSVLNELVKIVFSCVESRTFSTRRNKVSTKSRVRLGKCLNKKTTNTS